jgi:DNA invertase Pin-like site-specific DNA recombinase
VDTASGADPAETRPGFTKLLNDATYYIGDNKPFDIVIVYKIDRLARKLSVLTSIVDMFKSLEIDFVSTQELIDTSSSFGKAML